MGVDGSKVYLDSCVVMYIVEQRGLALRTLEARLREANVSFHLSDLIRMECLVLPFKTGDAALLEDYRRFFDESRALWIPMGRSVFTHAARLRAEYRIKTPDALHLAAALEAGCSEFWTNDRDLGSLNDLITITVVQ